MRDQLRPPSSSSCLSVVGECSVMRSRLECGWTPGRQGKMSFARPIGGVNLQVYTKA
jgi:hypothetical protein